jgi:oligopeptide/dipeptide ABC transporter ATP-binding protein
VTIDPEISRGGDTPVLEVEGLRVRLHRGGEPITIVEGVSFDVAAASSTALVGESGAGKSVSVRAVLGLLDDRRFEVTGSIRYGGVDVLGLPTKERRRRIANFASLVFQDPTRSLNPTMRIGWQVAEAMLISEDESKRVDKQEAKTRALQLLRDVGIADPEERFFAYPHQLSGGMRQRVVIAIALSCQPRIVFCDEPTSSLDVTTQALIMDLLEKLREDYGISIVLITHDLALASSRVDNVMVMYAGRLVESLAASTLFENASMPYTRALLRAVPDPDSPELLTPLPPAMGRSAGRGGGCVYASQCERATRRCVGEAPLYREIAPEHWCRCWFPGAFDGGVSTSISRDEISLALP